MIKQIVEEGEIIGEVSFDGGGYFSYRIDKGKKFPESGRYSIIIKPIKERK